MVPDFADCWYRSGLLLNFAFHGQTGRGKTHLAIAVGSAAVSAGRTVRFFGTAGLVLSLLKASREEALDKYLADIEKSDLVILDEFGYIPIDPEGARLLFQVISSCCERRSLILTTNIEFGKWGTVLGDEKLAAAAIDRMVHHGWLVEFGGESGIFPHTCDRRPADSAPRLRFLFGGHLGKGDNEAGTLSCRQCAEWVLLVRGNITKQAFSTHLASHV